MNILFFYIYLMNNLNKKGFTFIEMIIAISIVVLLAVVWNSSLSTYKQKSNNSKVITDLNTINNSLVSYSTEKWDLPMPGGNNNFFKEDTSYAHSWTSTGTYWVHWFITDNIIPKKYINYLPLDPITNQYYAYGKTKTGSQFEVAWVILKDSNPISLVQWNYTAEVWPYNLIREYNWPDFVYDKSSNNFPYNPDEKVLIAKINDFSWPISSIKVNNVSMSTGELLSYIFHSWDKIDLLAWTTTDLYFSDWTTSTLWDLTKASSLILSDMSFGGKNNLITKIKLVLWAWTIWNKATHLWTNSEFNIYTTDSSAAVRWTIFWVNKNTSSTTVSVIDWSVDVKKVDYTNNSTATKLSQNISNNISIFSTAVAISKSVTTWKSIKNYHTSLGITLHWILISTWTLDKIWKLKESIRTIVTFYEKSETSIKIKLKLNKIIKNKAKYLKLKVWTDKYRLNNTNWTTLNQLTLTWGTSFSGTWFSNAINWKRKIKLSFCKTKKSWKALCTRERTIRLINKKFTQEDTRECPHWQEHFNHECLAKPTWDLEEFKLIAYAPYNNWDLNMYKENWDTVDMSSWWTISTTQTWIIVWAWDFLSYSWTKLTELWDKFAIEMGVKGSDLKRSGPNYLFSLTGWIQILKNNINWLYYYNSGIQAKISNLLLNTLTDSIFYKIQFIKNNTTSIININNGSSNILKSSTGNIWRNLNINNLYIWSSNTQISQWKGQINYVKIYKK